MIYWELNKLLSVSIYVGYNCRMSYAGSWMSVLEAFSHLANVAMAIAVCYSAFSFHSWLRQAVTNRRADTASEVLGELEYFYVRLEQLVSWQYLLGWNEWRKTFNEIFRSHFLLAKMKAHRLNNEAIKKLLEGMEKSSVELPDSQRLATQCDGQGKLLWKEEAPKAKEKFKNAWEQYKIDWTGLKDLLSKEALYDMPPK